MRARDLGALQVSELGLGCMGMSEAYGVPEEGEAIRTIHRALEIGVTLLDTADVYGIGENEQLVGKAIAGRRDGVVLATKFGQVRESSGAVVGVNGRPDYVRQACEASLRRLGVEHVDLYQQHRPDPATPIEETVGAMQELVEEGKVRHIGLSWALPEDIRRAAATAPIASVQSEYSLFMRDVERNGVLDTCDQLGIGFLPFAPLGRGMLTGRFKSTSDFGNDDDDVRASGRFPWLTGEHFDRNLEVVRTIEEVAEGHRAAPAQIALAWLLSRRDFVVPIPGTKHARYVEENAGAAQVELSTADIERLTALPDAVGPRPGGPAAPSAARVG